MRMRTSECLFMQLVIDSDSDPDPDPDPDFDFEPRFRFRTPVSISNPGFDFEPRFRFRYCSIFESNSSNKGWIMAVSPTRPLPSSKTPWRLA